MTQLCSMVSNTYIANPPMQIIKNREFNWHNWRIHKHGIAFVEENGVVEKYTEACQYRKNRSFYYTFKVEEGELDREAFIKRFMNNGFVVGSKNLRKHHHKKVLPNKAQVKKSD